MAQVTKRTSNQPFKLPKHKYWLVIEDKYLVDYSEDVAKDIEEELNCGHGLCKICEKPLHLHRGLRFCKQAPFKHEDDCPYLIDHVCSCLGKSPMKK